MESTYLPTHALAPFTLPDRSMQIHIEDGGQDKEWPSQLPAEHGGFDRDDHAGKMTLLAVVQKNFEVK